MRVKVVIQLLLVGVVVILLAFVIRPKNSAISSQPAQAATGDSTPKTKTDTVGHSEAFSNSSLVATGNKSPEPNVANDDTENAEYEIYVVNRTTELENLGMMNDSNSLAEIESEFDSRDPRIQKAAVDAAVQFGSRDAIPALQDAYNHFDDPEQKIGIQKAIDFLKLPSMNKAMVSAGGDNGN